jgi:hypothetical protein
VIDEMTVALRALERLEGQNFGPFARYVLTYSILVYEFV